MNDLGYEITLHQTYEQAIDTITSALKAEGFGVLTRIDVRATLKEKIGKDFRPYVILGACNPVLAHRALEISPEVGLMLPCNVTVEAVGENSALLRLANPAAMILSVNPPAGSPLHEVAEEASARFLRILDNLKSQAAVSE